MSGHINSLDAKIESLRSANNYYINSSLSIFIEKKLTELNRICERIKVPPQAIISLQQEFLTSLGKINLVGAYLRKEFKRREVDSFEIDNDSLEQFIYKMSPLLKDMEGFVAEKLGIAAFRRDVLKKTRDVRKIINEYQNENKKFAIDDFNSEIDKIITPMDATNCVEIDVKEKLDSLLEELQKKENNYYLQLRFFSSIRKSNSSLQSKITRAKEIISEIKLDENVIENLGIKATM